MYDNGKFKISGQLEHIEYGMLMYPHGDEYEGQLVDNLKHGRGIYTYANGITSLGSWKNNKRHGSFAEIDITGDGRTITFENWVDGQLDNSKRRKIIS